MNPSEIAREKNLEEQDKEYETKLTDAEYKDAENMMQHLVTSITKTF